MAKFIKTMSRFLEYHWSLPRRYPAEETRQQVFSIASIFQDIPCQFSRCKSWEPWSDEKFSADVHAVLEGFFFFPINFAFHQTLLPRISQQHILMHATGAGSNSIGFESPPNLLDDCQLHINNEKFLGLRLAETARKKRRNSTEYTALKSN